MPDQELLTTQQAADEYGCTKRYIVEEIARGRLDAQRLGRDWLIKRKDFEAWRRNKPSQQK